MYQLSLALLTALTDASAALFLAFGNRHGRHRGLSDGQVGGTKGRSAHCARLPLGQGVPFVGARNQLPSSVVIGKLLAKDRRHMATVWGFAPQRCSLVHITHSCSTTLSRAPLIFSPPLYSMSPSFRNLFMKKFTRERVVPTISASVSCDSFGNTRGGAVSSPYRASSRSVRASRFSLELKS